ncbi:MAG: hypothetical protein U1F41_10520 [Burkholderiales bacterium]
MNSVAIAVAVLACTFAGGLVGLALHGRLPDQHREGDSKDVVKLVMGLIATVSALVLSLLISSSHRSYEAQQAEVQQIAVHLFQLDRALQRLGPDAAEGRRLLRGIVQAEVDRADGGRILQTVETPLEAQRAAALMFEQVSSIKPADDTQRFVQARVLQLINQLGDTRLLLSEQARGSISWPFLVILTCWLTILFVGFGLLAKRNATIVVSLLLGALCVSGAVFLILEMNRPYTGLMQVSIDPIRYVLGRMGQ